MDREITYAEALASHPAEVSEIIAQFRRGRGKHRDTDPATWRWLYRYAVSVTAFSINDLVSGAAFQRQQQEDSQPIDQRVADYVSRCSVSLVGGKGTFKYVPVAPPAFLAEEYRQRLEREAKEQAEFDALPAEEQERRLQDSLAELSQSPGFVALVRKP